VSLGQQESEKKEQIEREIKILGEIEKGERK